jgi:hypothetical protein
VPVCQQAGVAPLFIPISTELQEAAARPIVKGLFTANNMHHQMIAHKALSHNDF